MIASQAIASTPKNVDDVGDVDVGIVGDADVDESSKLFFRIQ